MHPGRKLEMKQLRPLLPQTGSSLQRVSALTTQSSSQLVVQQKLSWLQTAAQQTASLQAGELWAARQFPANGSPHPSHADGTRATHGASHANWQHSGRRVHTASQQAGLEQPGVSCGIKQLKVDVSQFGCSPQNPFAAATHERSHVTPQQNGSLVQTKLQQRIETQPGFECTTKHVSVGNPPPQAQTTPQPDKIVSSTHCTSHETSQQKGSFAQTTVQQFRSLQNGSSCAKQQSPAVSDPQEITGQKLCARSAQY